MAAEKDTVLYEETFLKLRSAGVKVKDIKSIENAVRSIRRSVKQKRLVDHK